MVAAKNPFQSKCISMQTGSSSVSVLTTVWCSWAVENWLHTFYLVLYLISLIFVKASLPCFVLLWNIHYVFSFLGSTSAASVAHSSGSSCVQAFFFLSLAVLLLKQIDFKSPLEIPNQRIWSDYFMIDKNTELICRMKFIFISSIICGRHIIVLKTLLCFNISSYQILIHKNN